MSKLHIGLIGYGKMGQAVEKMAHSLGHTVEVLAPSRQHPLSSSIDKVDICIDFSHPDSIIETIQKVANRGKSLIVGTTGWYDQIEKVKSIVEKGKIGFLYAPNFSIGIFLFKQLVARASELMGKQNEYDVAGWELHHRQKVDAPSGTAMALSDLLPHRESFTSIRCGSIPGTHTILFDSPHDSITLTHQAKGREGFAHGAVIAAEWLYEKKGFFTLEEMFR